MLSPKSNQVLFVNYLDKVVNSLLVARTARIPRLLILLRFVERHLESRMRGRKSGGVGVWHLGVGGGVRWATLAKVGGSGWPETELGLGLGEEN